MSDGAPGMGGMGWRGGASTITVGVCVVCMCVCVCVCVFVGTCWGGHAAYS